MATTGETLTAGTEAMFDAAFRTGDYAGAEQTFRDLLGRARADGDRPLEAAVLDKLGMLIHLRSVDTASNQPRRPGNALGNTGNAPGRAGNAPKNDDDAPGAVRADSETELRLFEEALKIHQELDDKAGIAESMFGIGLVYQVLRNDWETAMPHFREALRLAEEHGDLLLRSELHRHIGFYYTMSDLESDQALHHLKISHELLAELGDPRMIPGGTLTLGLAELADGLREQGLSHMRQALQQAKDADLSPARIAWIEKFLTEI
jgi:tetratricopeptide (TPR) repeat protein